MIAFVAATFTLAGLVNGTIGLGLPTVAVGLLGLVMLPAQAAALLVIPSLATNAWQLAAGTAIRPLLRRLWPLLVGIAAGTWLAAGALAADSSAQLAMGAALAFYGLLGLVRVDLRVPAWIERWTSLPVGIANGAITATTGTFVLPSVPYLQALGLGREDLIQALGLSFTMSTIALAATLAGHGGLDGKALGASTLALVPALLGMSTGTWLRTRVRPQTFRTCFFLGLVGLGAHLVLKA